MLIKNFIGILFGILTGVLITTVFNDISVFIPNLHQHEYLIAGLSALLLYLCLDEHPIAHGVFLGLLGVMIIDILGEIVGKFTVGGILGGIMITVILYASIGIIRTIIYLPKDMH